MGPMIITTGKKPPTGGLIYDWERGLDPWHCDAFPDELKDQALHSGNRTTGWFGLDWCGNQIVFAPDGSEWSIKS